MIWTFVSQSRAFSGCTLNGTTQDPQNGSTHRSNLRDCASFLICPTSFVFIPWHFSGGTNGGRLNPVPPLSLAFPALPSSRSPFRVLSVSRFPVSCIPGTPSSSCTGVSLSKLPPCLSSDNTSNNHRKPAHPRPQRDLLPS